MMLRRWFLNAVILLVLTHFLSGMGCRSNVALLVAAAVLGLINAVIRPVLLVFTLPINIVTLGLFTFVINALMLLLTSALVPDFYVADFSTALWGGFLFSLSSVALSVILRV